MVYGCSPMKDLMSAAAALGLATDAIFILITDTHLQLVHFQRCGQSGKTSKYPDLQLKSPVVPYLAMALTC